MRPGREAVEKSCQRQELSFKIKRLVLKFAGPAASQLGFRSVCRPCKAGSRCKQSKGWSLQALLPGFCMASYRKSPEDTVGTGSQSVLVIVTKFHLPASRWKEPLSEWLLEAMGVTETVMQWATCVSVKDRHVLFQVNQQADKLSPSLQCSLSCNLISTLLSQTCYCHRTWGRKVNFIMHFCRDSAKQKLEKKFRIVVVTKKLITWIVFPPPSLFPSLLSSSLLPPSLPSSFFSFFPFFLREEMFYSDVVLSQPGIGYFDRCIHLLSHGQRTMLSLRVAVKTKFSSYMETRGCGSGSEARDSETGLGDDVLLRCMSWLSL